MGEDLISSPIFLFYEEKEVGGNLIANQKIINNLGEYLSKSEIVSIASEIIQQSKGEFQSLSQQELSHSGTLSELDIIIQACELLDAAVGNEIIKNSSNFSDKQKSSVEIIIMLGTKLIFQLRKLITSEALNFTIGGTTSQGVLKEKTYSQDELFNDFKNLKISFGRRAVELNSALVSLKKLEETKTNFAEQWKKIEKYGFIKNKMYKNEKLINDGEGELYQKRDPDINVYMKFITTAKRKTLSYYYNTANLKVKSREDLTALLAYDRGWLYQWAKAQENSFELLEDTETPLRPLMTGKLSYREQKPGIKGGDDKNIQYKYRARRLISFNNIQAILRGGKDYQGIIPTLIMLKAQVSSSQTVFERLYQDFTTYNQEEIYHFIKNEINNLA